MGRGWFWSFSHVASAYGVQNSMKVRKIEKLLVANRGEIACRIFRTCRARGVETIAVYSDADRGALHTQMADHAIALGGSETNSTYLSAEKILSAAQSLQVDAIHPGYGFLSENAAFAESVARLGMAFVGPSAAAIRSLGDKISSKRIARAAGVPLLPSVEDIDWSGDRVAVVERMHAFGSQHGFPILVKASAGGGGRGMKKIGRGEDIESALESATRESESFFGDGTLFAERFVERARHVEVQIFGDLHGNVIHLFDRDCSCQRHHQKVIEEAPAPHLRPETRSALHAAACRLCKEAGYSNAGTVEFLVDEQENFYFLEVNSRLQVEHPVTEMITGLDLVALQLDVTEGRDFATAPVVLRSDAERGHAIEVRVCAEVPEEGFVASTGLIRHLNWPEPMIARTDTGFRCGDRVTHYYDSLLAKLIVHAADRAAAVAALYQALGTTTIFGVSTNLAFVHRLVGDPDFVGVNHHIQWAEKHALPTGSPETIAAVAALLDRRVSAQGSASPWASATAFRVAGECRSIHRVAIEDDCLLVTMRSDDGCTWAVGAREKEFVVELLSDKFHGNVRHLLLASDQVYDCRVLQSAFLEVLVNGERFRVVIAPPAEKSGNQAGQGAMIVRSPLPGKVVAVRTTVGVVVKEGDTLAILESMKMEHPILAPSAATVTQVHVQPGAVVEAKAALFDLGSA